MSGGIAYVYDKEGSFEKKCNLDMVQLENITPEDKETIHNMLHNHFKYTESLTAKRVITEFRKERKHFVKVMPIEYKRVLESKKTEKAAQLAEVSDG